jgi:hypothetical protein
MEDVDRVDECHQVEVNKVILYNLHNHARKREDMIPKARIVVVMVMIFVMNIHHREIQYMDTEPLDSGMKLANNSKATAGYH